MKPGGCPDFPTAQALVDILSGLLGTRPVAVTYSGYGLQPFWTLDDSPETLTQRRVLIRRFGRLIRAVASRLDCTVDSVFDAPRLMRMPGTHNHKGAPVPVTCFADTGGPLSVDRLREVLDENGIAATPEDARDLGVEVSAPATWKFADTTCPYTRATVENWSTDVPKSSGRHPWLVSQAVRLACMQRLGCISEADHRRARVVLATRFQELLDRTEPKRKENPGEVADVWSWGITTAATKTDADAEAEIGGLGRLVRHPHWQVQPTAPQQESPPAAEPDGETSDQREAWDSVALFQHRFPEIRWAIPQFYPPGLAMLSGPPKQGKSFLALRSGVAVATGSPFLGMQTVPGRVLYCALEDGARRAQTRLPTDAGTRPPPNPGVLTIRVVAPRVDEGLLDVLNAWADPSRGRCPARVVVLDVFQRVRPVKTTKGSNTYAEDYAALADLQKWANDRGICLVVLHHNRKATSDDPFDAVSGSTGMTGAVDMVMVLRGARGEPEAGLYVAGRDTDEDRDYSLIRENGLWRIGDMPVDLATETEGPHRFARATWRKLHAASAFGLTTEDISAWRGSTVDAARQHLDGMQDNGWVKALNASAPGVPVRWAAVTEGSVWPR